MRLLERFRRRWVELRDEGVRELDERQRLLRLLAWRDSFVALMILLPLLTLLQMYLLRDAGSGLRGVALLPTAAFILAALVAGVSWKMRGGGYSRNVAALQAVSTVLGFIVAAGAIYVLDWAGILPRRGNGSLLPLIIGALGGVVIGYLAVRRREPPND